MIRVRVPSSAWCVWIQHCLLRYFLFMDLQRPASPIHDNVPPPLFLPGASDITVRQGDVAVLPCAVRHLGTKQVAWRRIDADEFLTIGEMTWIGDERFAVENTNKDKEVSNWNLVIDKVRPHDAGVYECQVSSKLGHNKRVKLNVVGPPITEAGEQAGEDLEEEAASHEQAEETSTERGSNPLHSPVKRCGVRENQECLISIEGKRYVDLGEQIRLVCNASGGVRLPQDIDWFKDGDLIEPYKFPHITVDKYQSIRERAFVSELLVERARLRDTGEYVCRSSRNNIVNMKVTVLRADSPNKRRGTGSFPDSYSSAASRQQLHFSLAVVYTLLTLTLRS